MSAQPTTRKNTTQAHALGTYRHDVAYTAALKSQIHALGSYRHDIAYTGALKSAQHMLCQVVELAGVESQKGLKTGVDKMSAPVLFCLFRPYPGKEAA